MPVPPWPFRRTARHRRPLRRPAAGFGRRGGRPPAAERAAVAGWRKGRIMTAQQPADICMILEGTYPYVAGGVSSWVHDMLQTPSDRSFHLVCLLPARPERKPRYTVPGNAVSIDNVYLQDISAKRRV